MGDEKKENVFSVEGELVDKIERSKSYFDTSGAIIEKLLDFKYTLKTKVEVTEGKEKKTVDKEEEILVFEDLGGCKIEDKKFTIPVKVNPRIVKPSFTAKKRWEVIRALGRALEAYFGCGPAAEKDLKAAERENLGIVDILKFTNFDRKNFET